IAQQDRTHGPRQLERQPTSTTGAVPAGSPPAIGRLDEAAAPPPVDGGDPPCPPCEQEKPRPFHLFTQQRRVSAPDLLAPPHHGELRIRKEHRGHLHEVTESEPPPRFGSDEEHAGVAV